MEISREGGQSFNNSSYSIINGQVRQIERVPAMSPVTCCDPAVPADSMAPITVTHYGQQYSSNAVALSVRQPAPQDYLVVEVMTDKPGYVLGESVTLTLNLSFRKLIVNGTIRCHLFFQEQPPHLHIPWFESLGDWKTTDAYVCPSIFRTTAAWLGHQQLS